MNLIGNQILTKKGVRPAGDVSTLLGWHERYGIPRYVDVNFQENQRKTQAGYRRHLRIVREASISKPGIHEDQNMRSGSLSALPSLFSAGTETREP